MVLSVTAGITRQPENSKRAHLKDLASQNSTKTQREDPQEIEERKLWRERKKKRDMSASPPLRGPHFSSFTLRGPTPTRIWPNAFKSSWLNAVATRKGEAPKGGRPKPRKSGSPKGGGGSKGAWLTQNDPREAQTHKLREDIDKRSTIWGMFMSSTLEASVLLGKNYSDNLHSIKNTGKFHFEANVRDI